MISDLVFNVFEISMHFSQYFTDTFGFGMSRTGRSTDFCFPSLGSTFPTTKFYFLCILKFNIIGGKFK